MSIVAVVARDVDNTVATAEHGEEWAKVWSAAAKTEIANSQSHPRVAPWRSAFKRLGVSGKKFPSSIEAILRRALKGGAAFSINPLVDFYNTVSLANVVPAGGYDIGGIEELELRLTRDGDVFQALDDEESIPVPAGEVAYVVGSTVLTRHFVWRQSRQALIGEASRNVLLLSEVLGDLPAAVVDNVEKMLLDGLREIFGVVGRPVRLSENRLEAEW
ncbi:MAG: phenylalanine--tRNA ligase beta subunit-related protein [Acidobacteriota bacterium]|nr:phenylalanine--tRNA ligase beta subunit-related protein [Acidobacteriota bacterium]